MILKTGICCIAMALGIALFVPRQFGGLFVCVFLLVIGMCTVLLHDLKFNGSPDPASEGQIDGNDVQKTDSGSSSGIRRDVKILYDPTVRGRHAAPQANVENSPTTPTESG